MLRKKWLPFVALCVGMLVVSAALLRFPFQPRFVYSPLNHWLVSLAFLVIPLACWWLAGRSEFVLIQGVGYLVSLTLALPFAVLAIFSAYEGTTIAKGGDTSSVILAELQHDDKIFRLYQSNCGATCPFALVLNREIDVLGIASSLEERSESGFHYRRGTR